MGPSKPVGAIFLQVGAASRPRPPSAADKSELCSLRPPPQWARFGPHESSRRGRSAATELATVVSELVRCRCRSWLDPRACVSAGLFVAAYATPGHPTGR